MLRQVHHELQPAELRALSIAFVNAIGNLGGFVGPYSLAMLKTHLGPPCPTDREAVHGNAPPGAVQKELFTVAGGLGVGTPASGACVSSWAWGLVCWNGLHVSLFAFVLLPGLRVLTRRHQQQRLR